MGHNFLLVEIVPYSNCSNYDTRLAGKSSPLSGRVELCYNNVWFKICSPDHDDSNYMYENNLLHSSTSSIICQSMGYSESNRSKYYKVCP